MFFILEDTRIKDKCQIFTPEIQVKKMLDLAEYTTDLYGKKFLENSCGNGEVLVQAITRYIEDCKRKDFSVRKIKSGLQRDFIAYEVDKNRVEECINRLNEETKKYKIKGVKWNIRCEDYLASEINEKFDFIVGNPPYIAYPDLSPKEQKFIRGNFDSCKKGKFDYCYAFIERSYLQLAENGKFVYIIPNNIFKNVFANELREIIKRDIRLVEDYLNQVVFDEVLVSPAIIKIVKGLGSDRIIYRCSTNEKEIDKVNLKSKWVFDDIENKNGVRVGDNFKVSSSVATLLNEAFILKGGIINGSFYELGEHKIEKALIKKAASPKNKKHRTCEEHIIFPYYYSDGKLQHYSENEMNEKFPFAMKYLESYKEKLEKRNADNNAKWFEYGRSQALQNINQELILISSIISDCTEPYMLEAEEVPYSGLYIMPIGDRTLESLIPILTSNSFKKYINSIGINVSGTSKRISPKDIENYVY